jgi:hypothetical protein
MPSSAVSIGSGPASDRTPMRARRLRRRATRSCARLTSALQQNYLADALIWLYYSDLVPERLLIL